MTASFPPSTQWMDSFNIYPWMLGRDAQTSSRNSAAVYGLHDVKSFRGNRHLASRAARCGEAIVTIRYSTHCAKSGSKSMAIALRTTPPLLFSAHSTWHIARVPFPEKQTRLTTTTGGPLHCGYLPSRFLHTLGEAEERILSRSTTFSKTLTTIGRVCRTPSIQPTAIESIRHRREISPAGYTGSSTRLAMISCTAIRCHLTVSS